MKRTKQFRCTRQFKELVKFAKKFGPMSGLRYMIHKEIELRVKYLMATKQYGKVSKFLENFKEPLEGISIELLLKYWLEPKIKAMEEGHKKGKFYYFGYHLDDKYFKVEPLNLENLKSKYNSDIFNYLFNLIDHECLILERTFPPDWSEFFLVSYSPEEENLESYLIAHGEKTKTQHILEIGKIREQDSIISFDRKYKLYQVQKYVCPFA